MKTRFLATMALLTLFCGNALAAVQLNEIYFSPEDPKEDRQFFELLSDTGGSESLSGLWLLEIEGDLPVGTLQDNPGQVLNAIDLSAYSTGTNGLFLWRDSATVLDNSNAAGVQGPGDSTVVTQAFSPQILGFDLEVNADDVYQNNVHSFLLVDGYTGGVPTMSQEDGADGPDLDSDNDGVLDVMPWNSVVDAVSGTEDGDPGFQYASQVGGVDIALGFGADVLSRQPSDNQWLLFDSSSGDGSPAGFQGPFFANDGSGPGDSDAAFADGTEIVVFPTSTFLFATPGAPNINVPEPTSVVMLAIAALAAMPTRRRA